MIYISKCFDYRWPDRHDAFTHLQTCSICLLLSHCANRAACYAI